MGLAEPAFSNPVNFVRIAMETGFLVARDEGTVRLSAKAESDRITRRSPVQICPLQPFVS